MKFKSILLVFPLFLATATLPAKAEVNPEENPLEAPKVEVEPAKTKTKAVRVNVNLNNRYVFHFLAWIDEPYIAYRTIADPYNGKWHRIPVVRYQRVLKRIYYDRLTNTYGYFDRFGNPVSYLPARYRHRFNPL